ncbi:MAG: RNA polymerase subunit sigma [bacterium]|nr:MAG: RNA polymerase subunit sigma [bacterium]
MESINKLVEGDSSEWERFVKDYSPLIYSIIQRLCKYDVEDIVLHIFEKLIENDFGLLKRFNGNNMGSFLLYLKKIVYSKTQDYLKKSNRKVVYIPEYDIVSQYQESQVSGEWNPENEYLKQEMTNAIDEAISQLDLIYREVIYHYFKGYKIEEIAKILNIPYKTAQTRLSRAKTQLRSEEALKDFYKELI